MHNPKNGSSSCEVEEPPNLDMSSWYNIHSKWNDERKPTLIELCEI
jgi:hypothetical protein